MDAAQQLAPGQIRENALRDGGFTDQEVDDWKGQASKTMLDGGFSGQEIDDYFGTKQPNLAPVQKVIAQNVKKAQIDPAQAKPKREPIDASIKPVQAEDVMDALAAGYAGHFAGLFFDKEQSPIQMPENPRVPMILANAGASLVSDSIPMFAGGLAAGPGGAFAAPAAFNKALTDLYQEQSGDVDKKNVVQKLVGAAWEGTKGYIVGRTMQAVGESMKVANALGSPFIKALTSTPAQMAAETAAITTVSSALEGKLPSKRDFYHNAVAIGGLHAGGYVANKMMNIYGNTGTPPEELVQAADSDPNFKGKLLSENQNVPDEAKVDQPEVAAEQPPKPEEQAEEPSDIKDIKDRILSRIGEKPQIEPSNIKDNVEDYVQQKYAKYFSTSATIKEIEQELGDVPINDSAQVAMRLHNAVQDKVNAWIDTNTYDWETRQPNGEGYKPVIDDIKALGPNAIDDFNAYRMAKRTLNYEQRGLNGTGIDPKDAKAFVDAHPEMQPLMDRLNDVRGRALDYLSGSGRYSEDSIQAMKDAAQDSYAPLKRVLEPDPVTGKMPFSTKEIKKAVGDPNLKIIDPFESDLRDISNMIKLAHETEASNKFVDNFRDTDFIKRSDKQTGIPSSSQVAEYVDGKRTLWDAPQDAAEVLNKMSGNVPALDSLNTLLKIPATILRLGTVDNPLFGIRHAWRQQLTGATLSQTGLKVFQSLAYAPEYFQGGERVQQFVYDGGAVNSIMPRLTDWMNDKIYELDDKAPFLDKVWNGVKTFGELSHYIITQHDNIIRFAEYARSLEEGGSRTESAFAAREVLPDFQEHGLQKSALQQLTAFLDVHIKGQARMFQAIKSDIGNVQDIFTGDDPVQAMKNFGTGYLMKNLAYITVPSLLLALAQRNDDAIDDLPNWQKDAYWPIHIHNWRPATTLAEALSVKSAYPSLVRELPEGSGKYLVDDGPIIRIQKPFTNGIFFGSAPEAAWDAWKKDDPKRFESFAKTTIGSLVAEPIPTAINPIVEQATNHNAYTGQPIIRQSMENKLPEMQYDSYTSETAKVLGRMVSWVPLMKEATLGGVHFSSPKNIQNYMDAWGGTLGHYATQVLDQGLMKAGIVPPQVKPASTLADIPFVKEFMIRFPSAKAQSIQDFQDRYQGATQVQNSIKQLMKEGDIQGAIDLQDKYGPNMVRLTGVDGALQKMNGAVQKINITPDIDPVQKRQLIDGLMFDMVSIVKEGNKLMDEFEKQAKNKQ